MLKLLYTASLPVHLHHMSQHHHPHPHSQCLPILQTSLGLLIHLKSTSDFL